MSLLDSGNLNGILQAGSMMFFIIFMFYGQKIQVLTLLSQINTKVKRLIVIRNSGIEALKTNIKKFTTITPEQEVRLQRMIDSIAIPPVAHLDPAGIVPKLENIYKTYDRYLKSNLRRIVPDLSQAEIENLTNSLEVAIELNIFLKVVQHFVILAKKGGLMWVYTLSMQLPMLMDMAESLFTASGHFGTGLPIGDSFGPMVAQRFSKNYGDDVDCPGIGDSETTVHRLPNVLGRQVYTVKAKGPGGSVGNPGVVTQNLVNQVQPALMITIDAGLRLESEKTGEVSEGVGVAMGGPGMDRFRIEGALAESGIPVLTLVCKMSMKEAISAMPKEVLDQVDPTYKRVLDMIEENTVKGETVIVVGVGNTMGVE